MSEEVDVEIELEEASSSLLQDQAEALKAEAEKAEEGLKKKCSAKKLSFKTKKKPINLSDDNDTTMVLMGSPPVKVDVKNRKVMTSDEFFHKYKLPNKTKNPFTSTRQDLKSRKLQDQQDNAVHGRLMERRPGQCQLSTLTCTINRCNRQFESMRVLAWHMSYSHNDDLSHIECLVCGQIMKSVKGKNSHLVSAHRDLSVLHNAQCVEQCLPQSAKFYNHTHRPIIINPSYNFSNLSPSVPLPSRPKKRVANIDLAVASKVRVIVGVPSASAKVLDADDMIVVDVGGVDDLQVGSNCQTTTQHYSPNLSQISP